MQKKVISFALFLALSVIFFLDVRLLHYLRHSLLGLKIPGIKGVFNYRALAGIGYTVDFILSLPLTVVLSCFFLRKIRPFVAEPFRVLSLKPFAKDVISMFIGVNVIMIFSTFIFWGGYLRYELLGIPFFSSGHAVQPAVNFVINIIFSVPFFILFPMAGEKVGQAIKKFFGGETKAFFDEVFR